MAAKDIAKVYSAQTTTYKSVISVLCYGTDATSLEAQWSFIGQDRYTVIPESVVTTS